ncbi:MAG: DUF2520 domain-containing protein [Flavihumibacter sp.]
MKIVIIGTGNVATVFSRLLRQTQHQVVQVFGRNAGRAQALADAWQAAVCTEWPAIQTDADLYIVALSDAALYDLPWQLPDGLVVHTAGSVPKEALAGISSRYGVFYPLQSIRRLDMNAGAVPLLLEANSTEDESRLAALATDMGCAWQYCSAEDRKRLHLGAVWVNNFPNLLFSIAYRYCRQEKQDFRLLLPLIRETAGRLADGDPWQWQTGPALRHDASTLSMHGDMLAAYPNEQLLYRQLSEAIAAFNPAAE